LTREEFKKLFDQNFDAVRNYIYYRSGDAELSTDLAQETFLKLWEKQLEPDHRNIRALLFKISGNLFVSHYRRQKTLSRIKLEYTQEDAGTTPEQEAMYDEMKDRYERLLAELPEKQRTVFLMSRVDGMKYHEIARDLELSQKAVEKRMSQALTYLKERLEVQ